MSEQEVFEFNGISWIWDYGLLPANPVVEDEEDMYGYSAVIKALNPDVKDWYTVISGGYEGDFHMIGVDDENYWCFISGSFGSCSGCDWYLGLSSKHDAIEFLKHFSKVIIRKEYLSDFKKYLEFELQNNAWSEGIRELLEYLEKTYDKYGKRKEAWHQKT